MAVYLRVTRRIRDKKDSGSGVAGGEWVVPAENWLLLPRVEALVEVPETGDVMLVCNVSRALCKVSIRATRGKT